MKRFEIGGHEEMTSRARTIVNKALLAHRHARLWLLLPSRVFAAEATGPPKLKRFTTRTFIEVWSPLGEGIKSLPLAAVCREQTGEGRSGIWETSEEGVGIIQVPDESNVAWGDLLR